MSQFPICFTFDLGTGHLTSMAECDGIFGSATAFDATTNKIYLYNPGKSLLSQFSNCGVGSEITSVEPGAAGYTINAAAAASASQVAAAKGSPMSASDVSLAVLTHVARVGAAYASEVASGKTGPNGAALVLPYGIETSIATLASGVRVLEAAAARVRAGKGAAGGPDFVKLLSIARVLRFNLSPRSVSLPGFGVIEAAIRSNVEAILSGPSAETAEGRLLELECSRLLADNLAVFYKDADSQLAYLEESLDVGERPHVFGARLTGVTDPLVLATLLPLDSIEVFFFFFFFFFFFVWFVLSLVGKGSISCGW